MSRYVIPSDEKDVTIVVGWDPPLGTFFAQAEIVTVHEGEDLLWWIGYGMREVTTIAELRRQLLEKGVVIPQDVDDALRRDEQEPWTPGPLQSALGFTGKEERES